MRLFQSHVCIDDFGPPPPFLRDPTRDNIRHITQFRDGKHRVATPEKVAIMSLSTSFEKRRLGKQQQILSEMSQRCREQEVAELSSKLSAKCNLEDDRPRREMTFYTTNYMTKKFSGISTVEEDENSAESSTSSTPKPLFEKTYKHFPARKIIKHNGKYDFQKSSRNSPIKTPRIDPSPIRALVTQAQSDPFPKSSRFVATQRINGPIQLDHYTAPRDQMAPLVLPNIDMSTQEKIEAFTASRVHLGTRSKLDSMCGSNFSTKSSKAGGAKAKGGKTFNEQQTVNHFPQTTGGHTPPPNSAEPPHKISAR